MTRAMRYVNKIVPRSQLFMLLFDGDHYMFRDPPHQGSLVTGSDAPPLDCNRCRCVWSWLGSFSFRVTSFITVLWPSCFTSFVCQAKKNRIFHHAGMKATCNRLNAQAVMFSINSPTLNHCIEKQIKWLFYFPSILNQYSTKYSQKIGIYHDIVRLCKFLFRFLFFKFYCDFSSFIMKNLNLLPKGQENFQIVRI